MGKPSKRDLVTVYGLIDPRNRQPFYVGSTNKPLYQRLSEHLSEIYAPLRFYSRKQEVLMSIRNDELRPRIYFLQSCQPRIRLQVEAEWISRFSLNGIELTNNSQTVIGAPSGLRKRLSHR